MIRLSEALATEYGNVISSNLIEFCKGVQWIILSTGI